jgi:hypothetical protein
MSVTGREKKDWTVTVVVRDDLYQKHMAHIEKQGMSVFGRGSRLKEINSNLFEDAILKEIGE